MAPNPEHLGPNGFLEKRHYRHHHQLKWKQQSQLASIDHDVEGLHGQLARSISLILEAVGFQGADPEALESFAISVEECK